MGIICISLVLFQVLVGVVCVYQSCLILWMFAGSLWLPEASGWDLIMVSDDVIFGHVIFDRRSLSHYRRHVFSYVHRTTGIAILGLGSEWFSQTFKCL